MRNYQMKEQGIILIVILWILVILTTIALGFGHSMMVEYRISSYEIDKLKTMEIAKAGIERAIAELTNDTTNLNAGTLTSPWRTTGVMGSYQNVSTGDGYYTLFFGDVSGDNQSSGYGQVGYGLTDENSKININSASVTTLMWLTNGDQILVNNIMTWRGGSTTGPNAGAGDSYYTQLNPPYNCKYAPFDTVEELLLVSGMTPEILFGDNTSLNGILSANDPNGIQGLGLYPYLTVYSYDLNQALDGTRRINLTQSANSLGRALRPLLQHGLTSGDITNIVNYRQNNRFTSIGSLLNVPGITSAKFGMASDYVTISNSSTLPGLVNFNTASEAVLSALPGMNSTLAGQIIQQRTGTPFTNLGDVVNVIGTSPFINGNPNRNVSSWVTVRSSQFSIQSLGRLNNKPAYTRLIAVVDRAVVPIQILYFRDISSLGSGI